MTKGYSSATGVISAPAESTSSPLRRLGASLHTQAPCSILSAGSLSASKRSVEYSLPYSIDEARSGSSKFPGGLT